MTKFFNRFSIGWLFALLVAMSLGLMGSGTVIAVSDSYHLEMHSKRQQIMSLAQTAQSIIDHYVQQAQSGKMSVAEAQARALEAVSAIRFSGTNYIFVLKDDGTMLAHVNPALIGTNQLEFKDPQGTYVFKPMVAAAAAGKPAFNRYAFPRVPGGKPLPKLAIMLGVPAWGWTVGTGLYVDDIIDEMIGSLFNLLEVFLPLLAVFLVFVALAQRQVTRVLKSLTQSMLKLADGNLATEISGGERHDEIGQMARALQVFKDGAIDKRRLEDEAERTREANEAERTRHEAESEASARQQQQVVDQLATGLEKLAKGDFLFRLHEEFSSAYEKLRADFNRAMETLQSTMQSVAANAQGVRSGAGEITQASDDLSRRTEQQAASLEETAAALDEITATVRKTAESAADARNAATSAKTEAERSSSVVNETVNAMSGIETSSKQIGNIIGVIDEIAFQTNLLALNAGVEAARAGDAGRGFAVVATEVRALAQRSADAAKEIKTLISNSGAQVDTGVRLVGETGKALARIVEQVERLNTLVSQIAASASEQATGLAEVNSAVNQMDQVTQQNAAMVEQATAASHALARQAEALDQLMGQFQISGGTGSSPPALPASRRSPVLELN